MLFIFFFIGIITSYYIIPQITGVSFSQVAGFNEKSPRSILDAALILQLIEELEMFMLPVLLFAYWAHPHPRNYLGLKKPGKPIQWSLVIFLILGAAPLFLFIENLMQHIDLGSYAKNIQNTTDSAMKALLTMNSTTDFLKRFLVMAITPAICEELFFRSIGIRFLNRIFRKNITASIIVSALLFAAVHSSPYGFVSIFLAGVLLGVIYYLTGSVWCSILAHCIYNGLQIVLLFFSGHNGAIKSFMESNSLPPYIIISGAIIFVVALWLLIKNKTPLPSDWPMDFTPQELSQNAS
ncbi:MAG TPA: CPBP family intramembrane glutamic endopeptidase [Flavipsychrobacter sp.]|nr:CPBP family intramembrane glutamic endopeptidase [Flavipsychrobacter sp.]